MKKVLLISLLSIVVAVAGGAWWLMGSLDTLVAKAIRAYAPEITGVSFKLDSVHIAPSEGAAALKGLELGNPSGFHTEKAIAVANIAMKLDVASLTKDVVLIHEIVIESPEVSYEYASGGSNLDVIQRHVQSYVDERTGGASASDPKSPKKKVIIENLYVRNGKVSVSAQALNGKAMSVPLPDIHLTDIGKSSGGTSPAQAAKQVVNSITQGASKAASSLHLDSIAHSVGNAVSAGVDKVKGLFK